MGNYTDMIKPTDYGIHTYLENLLRKDYQLSCPGGRWLLVNLCVQGDVML